MITFIEVVGFALQLALAFLVFIAAYAMSRENVITQTVFDSGVPLILVWYALKIASDTLHTSDKSK